MVALASASYTAAGSSAWATFRSSAAGNHSFFVTTGVPSAADMRTIEFSVNMRAGTPRGSGTIFSNYLADDHGALSLLSSGSDASMIRVGINATTEAPYLHLASASRDTAGVLSVDRRHAEVGPADTSAQVGTGWTSYAFVRSPGTVQLYRNGLLVKNWTLSTLHIDTSWSPLLRSYPPLIGATPGSGTPLDSLQGSLDNLRAWSVSLIAPEVAALHGRVPDLRALPPALIMSYDFDNTRLCDVGGTRQTPGSTLYPAAGGPTAIVVEDRVGSVPAVVSLAKAASLSASALGVALGTSAVELATVGDGDFAVASTALELLRLPPSDPLADPVTILAVPRIETYLDGGTLGPLMAPLALLRAPCAFCGDGLAPVPDAGESGMTDLALVVPVSTGTCATPPSAATPPYSCTGMAVACRVLSADGALAAVPVPRAFHPDNVFPRPGNSRLVCSAGRRLVGSGPAIVSALQASPGSATGPGAAPSPAPLVKFRWRTGVLSASTPELLSTTRATRQPCLRPMTPYKLSSSEASSLAWSGASASTEEATDADDKLTALHAANQGHPVAGLAPRYVGPDGSAAAQGLSLLHAQSFDGRTLPTFSMAVVGIHVLPGVEVPAAILDAVGSGISEPSLRVTLHPRNILRRLVRPARSRAFGARPAEPALQDADRAGAGLRLAPAEPFPNNPATIEGTLVLDGRAWRGMLPVRYFRSALGQNDSLTPIVASAAKALRFLRVGPAESSATAPGAGASLGLPPAPPAASTTTAVPAARATSTERLAASIHHFECDRSEPGWPRWPNGGMSVINVTVRAAMPLSQASSSTAAMAVRVITLLASERIGLSTSAATPFEAAEPWMADTSDWLSLHEASLDVEQDSIAFEVRSSPVQVAGVRGRDSAPEVPSSLDSLASDIVLSFNLKVRTRLRVGMTSAAVVLDGLPQMSSSIQTPSWEVGHQQLRSIIEAAHHVARAISLATGHGESWAQRQRCVASLQ